MPPRNRPICKRCNKPHWSFIACEHADTRLDQEEKNEQRRRDFIIRRPREGYREFGDQLGGYERAGRMNGAPILRRKHREPGSHAGSFTE